MQKNNGVIELRLLTDNNGVRTAFKWLQIYWGHLYLLSVLCIIKTVLRHYLGRTLAIATIMSNCFLSKVFNKWRNGKKTTCICHSKYVSGVKKILTLWAFFGGEKRRGAKSKVGQTRILVERGKLESKVGANGNSSLVWCPWIRSWDKLEFCFTPKYDSNSANPTTIWSDWNFPLLQLPVQPNRYSEKLANAFRRRTTYVNLVF